MRVCEQPQEEKSKLIHRDTYAISLEAVKSASEKSRVFHSDKSNTLESPTAC